MYFEIEEDTMLGADIRVIASAAAAATRSTRWSAPASRV